ncbi:MAG: hypothetical protein HN392_05125 [Anaerolineae bacterium]|nr:hypothetical protein [Anaerolineae bacterium]MBT7073869.1 hypothetical protein [Anaerolineae bacterium]MBT7782377.1 hypothetical protein [Anaerolineae bacterium]
MMKKKYWFAFILLIVFSFQACQPLEPVPDEPIPLPATEIVDVPKEETVEEVVEEKPSVVLISWDGSRADLVHDLMDEGLMPNFASVADAGVRAEYAQSIDPSLTAAAHNSMSSGSFPTHTGITSNSFHVVGDDFYWYRKGFDEVMTDAEPIWVTASKNGLTTASVFFVGGSPSHEGQLADYTVGYGLSDAYSKQVNVSLSPTDGWSDAPESYSPALEGKFTIQNVGKVFLYVFDSTDDSTENYDTVILNTENATTDTAKTLKQNEWASLILLKRAFSGGDFLIQDISSEKVKIYHTGIYRNNIAPKELLDAINEKFGAFPAGADSYALGDGWITPEDNLYLLEMQSVYMAEVAAWVYESYQPDLMLTWQDPFDSAGHQFLMVDERQLNYSPELAEAYRENYIRAAQIADSSLGIMLDAFDLEKITLMIGGDHGMAPIHSRVYLNTLLENAGLLTLDSKNYVVLEESKAFAICSGGAVHVYINLEGRETGGIVPESELPAIRDEIMGLFENLTDPETDELIFQRVLPRESLADLGLVSANSGDIFAQAVPGYHLDGWRGNDEVFAPADFYGQHGYDSTIPEMHTIFLAAGVNVFDVGEIISPVHIVDYAPTIAEILGFEPAPNTDGKIIPALVK